MAGLGKFQGVAQNIVQYLAEPVGVAFHDQIGRDEILEDQPQLFFFRPVDKGLDRRRDLVHDLEGDRFQLQFACHNLLQVQNIIDDHQQVIGGFLDELQIVALLGVQLGLTQQAGDAQDAIHGRPDLMAHMCQEGFFCPRYFVRELFGEPQLLFHLYPIGDILRKADHIRLCPWFFPPVVLIQEIDLFPCLANDAKFAADRAVVGSDRLDDILLRIWAGVFRG